MKKLKKLQEFLETQFDCYVSEATVREVLYLINSDEEYDDSDVQHRLSELERAFRQLNMEVIDINKRLG